MPQTHLWSLSSKTDTWERPCSGRSCSWMLVRKAPYHPTYSHYPFQPRKHCHQWPLFLAFVLFPSRMPRERLLELNYLVVILGPRWEVGGGSQFGGGVGGVEMARQQQPCKVGFVRPTGEGGEDWFSGSPGALGPSVFKTDVLHPSQSWGQRWELRMQSRSRGN